MEFYTLAWAEEERDQEGARMGRLLLLDQTRLPEIEAYLEITDIVSLISAIQRLAVRGAPALGCAGALGLAAAACRLRAGNVAEFVRQLESWAESVASARPTAVNLSWGVARCLERLRRVQEEGENRVAVFKSALVEEGTAILEEDKRLCQAIGEHGLALFERGQGVAALTHCNAGALATGGRGTALAPIYAARDKGLEPKVWADETRPLLQGSRLTAWELRRAGVDTTVICDNMAAWVMAKGMVDFVLVGADRVAANGDTANKIGTYGLAVLAAYHRLPFYVAAPYSTIDLELPEGGRIPIEERAPDEVRRGFGPATAPAGCPVYNPAFDITPADLVSGIITERGILRPPYSESLIE